MEFVKAEAPTTDIFCFQEVYFSKTRRPEIPWIRANLAFELNNILTDFSMLERLATEKSYILDKMSRKNISKDIRIGEAIFVRKPMKVTEHGGFHTYAEDGESVNERIEKTTGNFQFVKIKDTRGSYLVGNIHGVWLPHSKSDTPKRIEQSRHLKNFIKSHSGRKILCGDFNVLPKTKSIELLSLDMRDLIKEYDIKSTRTRYYPDMRKYADYISDYVFVSSDIQVNDFKVLENEVSDHSPLLLEFF